MKNISDIIKKAEKHLDKSVPRLDKFEKASILNFIRTEIEALIDECPDFENIPKAYHAGNIMDWKLKAKL